MVTLFQFTPLREGRRDSELLCNIGLHFNSRPSARGDLTAEDVLAEIINFNSRPSARGDTGFTTIQTPDVISIHAPPRGATS